MKTNTQHIIIVLIGLILGACSAQNSQDSSSVPADSVVEEMTSNCYVYVNKKDTV